MDRQLEKLLASAGRAGAASKPVLEINPGNELIQKLAGLGESEIALREDAAQLLLDEALVADGERPRDAKAFSARLGRVIGRALPG
jgi:molecular chaperone HtpG